MIKKELLLTLFDTTCIQRWNDKLRPVNLVELDFQAHRLMIAYFLGKWEELESCFSWIDVIDSSIFDLLETAILTDLKWDVKERLNENQTRRSEKDTFVLQELRPMLSAVGNGLLKKFCDYQAGKAMKPLSLSVSRAAKTYARRCEFRLLENANPSGYEIEDIGENLQEDWAGHNDLKGCQQLNNFRKYRHFVDLCGELRFQVRWSHLHLVPRTSVLGHSMFVAVIAYLFSLEVGACERQRVNNFFTGLFHDLEETLIRDVRSPLKREIPGLGKTLKEISKEKMEQKVLTLLPPPWVDEFRLFSMEELKDDFATVKGKRKPVAKKVFSIYNMDKYCPRSGSLVNEADKLAAFIEAFQGIANGCGSSELEEAKDSLPKEPRAQTGQLDIGAIYSEFTH
ncbi:MAG: HD domain-containing protein [Chloroflexi bacterium]|nr:HD domain-containing protein [Chloroflexota bacterium]